MCCSEPIDLPDEVAAMLLSYQALQDDDPDGLWGDRSHAWYRTMGVRTAFLAAHRRREAWSHVHADPSWLDGPRFAEWLRAVVAEDGQPEALTVARVSPDGSLAVSPATRRFVIPNGEVVQRLVLLDSALDFSATFTLGSESLDLPAHGATLVRVAASHDAPDFVFSVRQKASVRVRLVEPVEAGRIVLRAGMCARWSVTDEDGNAWFPEHAKRKWDWHGRPFFHGEEIVVDVPAVPLMVQVAKGLEFTRASTTVTPLQGREEVVALSPQRWIDPASSGWFGADLHVHMNYGAELVISPSDAALMQFGEGLHFMNLVAANESTSLIYDREALEAWAGQDLPWSSSQAGDRPRSSDQILARMGVEYRNNLLGHFHATGPSQAPSRYHTGHEHSDTSEDWPPNSVALQEFRSLGAVTGYCHPVRSDMPDDAPPDAVFQSSHTVEARELVADAALGLVDSMDVLSNLSDQGASVLYRRLLGAGIPLAVTAGTDSMLSAARNGVFSNPPGWARVYAQLDGSRDRKLTVSALQDAIRAGRTIATNGPWITLSVFRLAGGDIRQDTAGASHGPGARPSLAHGERVRVLTSVSGPGVTSLRIYTADGVVASKVVAPLDLGSPPDLVADTPSPPGVDPENAAPAIYRPTQLEVDLEVTAADFVVAVADGPGDPSILSDRTMAHTSPVYLDVDGQRVARSRDATWCLEWLDQLQHLALEHGIFHHDRQRDDLLAVIDYARTYYQKVVIHTSTRRESRGPS